MSGPEAARSRSSGMTQSSSSSAEERTELAQDRTLLASERTFASWMRTGLGFVAVGLGLTALFRELEPLWIAKALSSLFMLIGVVVFWAAERRACQVQQGMPAHAVKPFDGRRIRVIAYSTILVSLSVVALIWMLV